MMSLSEDKQADVIDAFNTTSRYLDNILNIKNVCFDNMVSQIYPSELHLNKANTSDTDAAFLDLHLSISNDIVSTKIYDKRDDFDFEIVNFPLLDGDVPRSTSYGVYISQLVRFARAFSYVADFNTRNKLLTQKLLKQGYREGCPLSPYFIICIELLSNQVRKSPDIKTIYIVGKENKTSLFADDASFILDESTKSFENLKRILDKFTNISGLKLNAKKCQVLRIGSLTSKTIELMKHRKFS